MDNKERMISVPVGVVLAREDAHTQWLDHVWRPVDIALDPPPGIHGRKLDEEPGRVRYFAKAEPLELHRRETEAYQFNLSGKEPSVWVVLQEDDDPQSELPYYVHLVTASPYEAQDYLDSGEDVVEVVAMPEALREIVSAFIEAHPEAEPFKKRKRDKLDIVEHRFGQQTLAEIRQHRATEALPKNVHSSSKTRRHQGK